MRLHRWGIFAATVLACGGGTRRTTAVPPVEPRVEPATDAPAAPPSPPALPIAAIELPELAYPEAVDSSGARALVGTVRAERTQAGWEVAAEGLGVRVEVAVREGDGWLFVSWGGDVLRSSTFTGPLHTVGHIASTPTRVPSVGRTFVLSGDFRLYAAGPGEMLTPIEGPTGRGIDGAVFSSPARGMVRDLVGQVHSTTDGGRTWRPVRLPRGTSAIDFLDRAAHRLATTPPPLPREQAIAALRAVLARTGPWLPSDSTGVARALGGGRWALRPDDDELLLLEPDGQLHDIMPPCGFAWPAGATLEAECESHHHVLDLERHRWLDLGTGNSHAVSPTGRTAVIGSGCSPEDPLRVFDVATGTSRTLPGCHDVRAITDSIAWERAHEGAPVFRVDLASGARETVPLEEPVDRWETFWSSDGSAWASRRAGNHLEPFRPELLLISPEGRLSTAELPGGVGDFAFDGSFGLAATETEAPRPHTRPALWVTQDRGHHWAPVAVPRGALLQAPECARGICQAGSVRVASASLPALPVREETPEPGADWIRALRCSKQAIAAPPEGTYVVETPHATARFAIGPDDRVEMRWQVLGAAPGAEASTEGTMPVAEDRIDRAVPPVVLAATRELLVFKWRGDEQTYLARRGRGVSPAPLEMQTGALVALPDDGLAIVGPRGVHEFDRSGRKRSSMATDASPTGWAVRDGEAGLAFFTGLGPGSPLYLAFPSGPVTIRLGETPIRGCVPGTSGTRFTFRSETIHPAGTNGALAVELTIQPDGSACVGSLYNTVEGTYGYARLTATGPLQFEGVRLETDEELPFQIHCTAEVGPGD